MWRRFKRMVQSNLGRLTDLGGGSGLTGDLDREARALERQLPELDRSLAMIKGEVTFTEDKLRKLKVREQELDALTQAADARGSGQASRYGLELEQVRLERAQHERNLVTARVALEKAQDLKRVFVAERDRKVTEARERQRALLELQRDDMKAELGELDPLTSEPPPRAEAPRAVVDEDPARSKKTVGPPLSEAPSEAVAPQSKAAKTIGPVVTPAAAPAPAEPAPASVLKIKIRPAAARDDAPVEARGVEPQQAEKAPTGSFPAQVAAATSPSVGSGAASPDIVGELERLARLHEQGVLTDEELEQAKRRLLGSGADPGP